MKASVGLKHTEDDHQRTLASFFASLLYIIMASKQDFDSVREHLLKHSFGTKHPAVVAAIKGLDDAWRTIERDRKLQAKFNTTTTTSSTKDTEEDFSRIERPTGMDHFSTGPPPVDDWHDITKDSSMMEENSTTEYGSLLAHRAVQSMGDNAVACRMALGALTVALHATLLQHGYQCTGIPPKSKTTGFAPPVRVIQQFLPLDWEGKTCIQLRYRKTHAVELHTKLEGASVTISLGDISMAIERLEDHINTTSWSKATQNGSKLASPTLHYKSLAKFLGDFAQRFDLGEAVDDHVTSVPLPTEVPPLHQVPESVPRQPVSTSLFNDPLRVPTVRVPPSHPYAVGAGDLLPTGLLKYPQRGMPGANFPNQGGNLVGPNHPMFLGGGGNGDPMDHGMMPRYDPIGPPGGPTELDEMRGGRGRKPPGGTGIPNNDMEKRPRFGDNNMFL